MKRNDFETHGTNHLMSTSLNSYSKNQMQMPRNLNADDYFTIPCHNFPNKMQKFNGLTSKPMDAIPKQFFDDVSSHQIFKNYTITTKDKYEEYVAKSNDEKWGNVQNRTQNKTGQSESLPLRKKIRTPDVSLSQYNERLNGNFGGSLRYEMKHNHNFIRIFTGTIKNVYAWSELKNNFQILFEILATVDNVRSGRQKSEKVLILSDSKTGPTIQVTYYEIDQPLTNIAAGDSVICTGRLVSRSKFHAFKVEQILLEEKCVTQRIAFMCNRAADEIASSCITE